MIGQVDLIKKIDNLDTKSFPRFAIVVGVDGSEKVQMAKYIARKLQSTPAIVASGVDDIRDMITNAYKTQATVTYIIEDGDGMSVYAKNALLKITEEPPNNAYVILIVSDLSATLDTLKSRGTVFHMNPYTVADIKECARMYGVTDETHTKIIVNLCDTPKDVETLANKVDEFYAYVNKVVDHIAVVSGANSFKIGDKINFKDSTDKYDLRLFWKAFMKICLDRCVDNEDTNERLKYIKGIQVTSKSLQELRVASLNKQMMFDTWLLNIRKEWM